jgi:hypothetical protein
MNVPPQRKEQTMSQWANATPKERESAPASIFCGPHRSFPVADESDFRKACRALGRAGGDSAPIKACLMRKAKSAGWTMPQAWMSSAFTLNDATFSDDLVIRRGKIFAPGDYPDKDFSATLEELYVAASLFQPVMNDLEHMPTILDGHLGSLRSVELAPDGSLIGEVEIPRWLHDSMGERPIKDSLQWDRETKTIIGNALVLDPRVPDAQLVAAFTNSSAYTPESLKKGDETGDETGKASENADIPGETGEKDGEKGKNWFRDIFHSDTERVSFFAALRAIASWSGTAPPTPVAAESPVTAEEDIVNVAETAEFKALQAQFDALSAREKERSEREARRDAEVIRERAEAWAVSEVNARRVWPADKDKLVAMFVDAATDDALAPRDVSFTRGTEEVKGTRVQALMARQATASVVHALTQEQLRDASAMMAARPDSATPQKMTQERKTYLLELSGFKAN